MHLGVAVCRTKVVATPAQVACSEGRLLGTREASSDSLRRLLDDRR